MVAVRQLFLAFAFGGSLSVAGASHRHRPHKLSTRLSELLHWEPTLGHFAFNVTASDPQAVRLFKVGLLLLYNFDQTNAKAAFQEAIALDETCAMCHWGLAHAAGPYLNRPVKAAEDLALGLGAAANASAVLAHGVLPYSAKERLLIEAAQVRFPADGNVSAQAASYRRYAARLRELRLAGGPLADDPDLQVFDAEAMMVLMCGPDGYHFYISRGDALPPVIQPETKEASDLLRAALKATNQTQPYAQHLLIHSTEMSNAEAETAVAVAARLFKNMAGLQDQHLQHMTSHTDLRTGRYHEAVLGNQAAVHSDSAYLHHGLVPYGPGHDSTFLVAAALFGGERATAYKYVKVMQGIFAAAPERRDGPDGNMAWSYPMVAALRFGDWAAVSELDVLPPGNFSERWPYGYGVLRRFARAVAELHLGRAGAARAELAALRALAPAVAATGNVKLANLTRIANHTAAAALAAAAGDHAAAVAEMSAAVDVEMGMAYNEPPDWLLPTRECLGQAQLGARAFAAAEATFRAALYGYSFHAEPHCGWALFGLREALRGQPPTPARQREISELSANLTAAWRYSDVELRAACELLVVPPAWLI